MSASGLRGKSITLAVSIGGYALLGFFVPRESTIALFVILAVVWLLFPLLIKYFGSNLKHQLLVAIALRLVLLLSFPNLSDDIYRFFWDGELMAAGMDPFEKTPSEWMENPASLPQSLDQHIYEKLNSPDYFSVYPTVNQLVFTLAAALTDRVETAAIIIRIILIAADLGVILLLMKLLRLRGMQRWKASLYAFNPLVILEITGNLHFEGLMLFFLLASLYYFFAHRTSLSSLSLSASIATKLVPLIFIPYLLLKIKSARMRLLWLMMLLVGLGVFIGPLLQTKLWLGLSNSLPLYFQKFEFNASIYYLIREVGYWIKGYNIIQTAGPYMALVNFIAIVIIATIGKWKNWQPSFVLLLSLFIYLLLSTTVHPWYVITLIGIGILSGYYFPILWSALIMLTYIGYHENGYQEPIFFVQLEYILVMVYFIYELYRKSNSNLPAVFNGGN